MEYVGTYDRTICYNPGNKYCIISVKTSDQSVPQQDGVLTVTGTI